MPSSAGLAVATGVGIAVAIAYNRLTHKAKGKVRHCVMGKFTPEATAEQKKAMVDAIYRMEKELDIIVACECALDLGIDPSGNSFCATLDFKSEDDYKTYAKHEVHQQVIATYIKPILAPGSRNASQILLK